MTHIIKNHKISMNDHMMVRYQILEQAQKRFFMYGFMNVSMDEIASLVGMSKKTIYQHFPSKNRLIEDCIKEYIIAAIKRYKQIVNSPIEYIDKLYKILSLVGNTYLKMSKSYRDDLRLRRPDIWHRIEEIRKRTVFTDFTIFLNEGIEKGIVRSGIHPATLLIAYIGALQGVYDSNEVVKTTDSSVDVFDTITRIMLDGILTEKAWQ